MGEFTEHAGSAGNIVHHPAAVLPSARKRTFENRPVGLAPDPVTVPSAVHDRTRGDRPVGLPPYPVTLHFAVRKGPFHDKSVDRARHPQAMPPPIRARSFGIVSFGAVIDPPAVSLALRSRAGLLQGTSVRRPTQRPFPDDDGTGAPTGPNHGLLGIVLRIPNVTIAFAGKFLPALRTQVDGGTPWFEHFRGCSSIGERADAGTCKESA